MFTNLKAISEGSAQHTGPGRGPNQGERSQFIIQRPGADSLTQYDVDAIVFHRGVQVFFNCLGHTVYLIDKQNAALGKVGKVRQQILGCFQTGAIGHLDDRFHFRWNDGCEGSLSKPGRAVEQDVPQRFTTLASRLNRNFESFNHITLPNHFIHAFRAQRAILFSRQGCLRSLRVRLLVNCFSCHECLTALVATSLVLPVSHSDANRKMNLNEWIYDKPS